LLKLIRVIIAVTCSNTQPIWNVGGGDENISPKQSKLPPAVFRDRSGKADKFLAEVVALNSFLRIPAILKNMTLASANFRPIELFS
jgi:hypothetical protein